MATINLQNQIDGDRLEIALDRADFGVGVRDALPRRYRVIVTIEERPKYSRTDEEGNPEEGPLLQFASVEVEAD